MHSLFSTETIRMEGLREAYEELFAYVHVETGIELVVDSELVVQAFPATVARVRSTTPVVFLRGSVSGSYSQLDSGDLYYTFFLFPHCESGRLRPPGNDELWHFAFTVRKHGIERHGWLADVHGEWEVWR